MDKGKKASSIISSGPEMIKRTRSYDESVERIKAELTVKYSELLNKEGNLVRRFLLEIRMQLEIRRAIRDLTSSAKLHLKTQGY